MLINFASSLKNLDGTTILRPTPEGEPKPVTLGDVAAEALMSSFPDEQHLPGIEKMRRGKLAFALYGAGEKDVTAEDVTLVKLVVGKACTPIIVAQAYDMLDV